MRLSPFDSWAFAAFGSQALGHFLRGRYEAAGCLQGGAIQSRPQHQLRTDRSAGRDWTASMGESRCGPRSGIAADIPCSRQFAGVDCAPALAASLTEALRAAGLPE